QETNRRLQFHCSFEGCTKFYHTKPGLKFHMYTHTGIKTFACSYCGKQFIYRNSVVKHERTHNLGLNKCDHCGKRFTRKGYLSMHGRFCKKTSHRLVS